MKSHPSGTASRWPRSRLSRTVTWWPASRSWAATTLPMYPAPPVTRSSIAGQSRNGSSACGRYRLYISGEMTVAFDVERFERVDASSGTALLRLAGTFGSGDDPGTPQLLVDDGHTSRRVSPLPDPSAPRPAAGGAWRAAF